MRWGLVVTLAACSGTSGGKDGRDTTDTTVDPTVPTTHSTGPAEETLRVVSYVDLAPLAGVDLLVSDADGAYVDTVTTDATGEVHTDVPTGGSVSFGEDLSGPSLTTYFDVPDGATVVFPSYRFLGPTAATGPTETIAVTVTDSPVEVDTWQILTRCDGAQSDTPGPFTLDTASCPGHDTDQVLALGWSSAGSLVAWSAAFDLPLPIVADVPLDHSSVLFHTVTATGWPPNAGPVELRMDPRYGEWRLLSDLSETTGVVGDSVSDVLEVPLIEYDSVRTSVDVTLGASRLYYSHAQPPPLEAEETVDFSGVAVLSVDPPDLTDPMRPSVHWVNTVGSLGDGAFGSIGWTVGGAYGQWTARFDPAVRHTFQVPELPDDWAAYLSAPPDSVTAAYMVASEDDFLDGYADVLAAVALPDAFTDWSTSAASEAPAYP